MPRVPGNRNNGATIARSVTPNSGATGRMGDILTAPPNPVPQPVSAISHRGLTRWLVDQRSGSRSGG